jgi:hypothetical protein
VLSEAMAFYGLHRDFEHAGYFPTTHNEKIYDALKVAVQLGRLVVLSGIVGCGKSKLLRRIKDDLQRENQILVSKSMALVKDRVTVDTLVVAMFHDLSTEREVSIPGQAEKRERKLVELISKRKKPVVLLVDEAHRLQRKTLIDLKLLSELVEEAGEVLSLVLAGHPKLKNELSRATMEEVGSRSIENGTHIAKCFPRFRSLAYRMVVLTSYAMSLTNEYQFSSIFSAYHQSFYKIDRYPIELFQGQISHLQCLYHYQNQSCHESHHTRS